MIREIISFYKTAPKLLKVKLKKKLLGNFLNKKNYQNTLSSIT